MEKTFVMVKPDGVRRGLIGEIVKRIEAKGYQIQAMKMFTIDEELAKRHYEEHAEKPFFGDLVSFITSGRVVAMTVEGEDAIAGMRVLMGATNPVDADAGTIRADLAESLQENLVHGSDSPASAQRALDLFFGSH